jgi:hypothetical protein
MSHLRLNRAISCPEVLRLVPWPDTAIFLVRGVSQVALVSFQLHGMDSAWCIRFGARLYVQLAQRCLNSLNVLPYRRHMWLSILLQNA